MHELCLAIFLNGLYAQSVFCRRTANELSKDPVKVCERLETCSVSYLTNGQATIVQQNFSALNADVVQVSHERYTGFRLELPAKVERTHIERAGDLLKSDSLKLMICDKIFRTPHQRRISVRLM